MAFFEQNSGSDDDSECCRAGDRRSALSRRGHRRVASLGTFLFGQPRTVSAARQGRLGHRVTSLSTHTFTADTGSDIVGLCFSHPPRAHVYDEYAVGPNAEVDVLGAIVDANRGEPRLAGRTRLDNIRCSWSAIQMVQGARFHATRRSPSSSRSTDEVAETDTAKGTLRDGLLGGGSGRFQ